MASMGHKLTALLAGFFGANPLSRGMSKPQGNRALPPEMQKEVMAAAAAKRERRRNRSY